MRCESCKGTGKYVGLVKEEPCVECDGKGRIVLEKQKMTTGEELDLPKHHENVTVSRRDSVAPSVEDDLEMIPLVPREVLEEPYTRKLEPIDGLRQLKGGMYYNIPVDYNNVYQSEKNPQFVLHLSREELICIMRNVIPGPGITQTLMDKIHEFIWD